ncbi:hypothetical protein D3C87_1263730 [compost metagenome]
MAFFAASPISVTMPIWKYTSFDKPRSRIAIKAPKMPNGTAVRIESGKDHDSYCAARIRNTMTMPNTKTIVVVLPDFFCSNASPLQAKL